ncbi:hypothetical protein Taro_040400 [Colocasia esculenta]|uniref:Uncharacterized protein n=1 Tax=Colocasia esculenta TaxID=4460 RepID=A0A843WBS6_COLES|nr:hypothetical protein [Colocasia esculenta]
MIVHGLKVDDRELDDVPLLPEFATPPAPKRQKKTVGARVRSKKHGISVTDLETIEEDNDDETSEPSDNLVYQTSNNSTSKTSTPMKSLSCSPSEEDKVVFQWGRKGPYSDVQ